MKLLKILEETLKTENSFLSDEGELKKWVVINKAQNFDADLLELLLSNEELKARFFVDVKGVQCFKQNDFVQFLEQKNFLNDSYTQFKNKVGLTIDGKYLKQRNEVALVWPFKDCVLEGGQSKEEEKREEIFFNEVLAQDEITQLLEPKVLTNAKRIDKDGEKSLVKFKRNAEGTITDNLIIKGNNLLALHSLEKEFAGKVKLIYIDPPYNTGDDGFGYNDSFNHSTWMTFMRNRLQVAKQLLKPDGVIFIQINDIEESYLKILCDEIFTREAFHTSICVQMSHLSGVKMAHKDKKIPKIKEYILFYSNTRKPKLIPQYIPATWDAALERYSSYVEKNGLPDDECSRWNVIPLNEAIRKAGIEKDSREASEFKLENADVIFRTARNRGADYSEYDPNVFSKVPNDDGTYYFTYKNEDVSFAAEKVQKVNGKLTPMIALGDIWTDIGINNLSNEGGVDLRFGKKPEKLIERVIKLVSTSSDDIVMDFFSGSGTTGAVAHKLGKQYILVEQMDNHVTKSLARLRKVIEGESSGISKENNWVGGGEFVYFELKKYNQSFLEQIEAAKNSKALLKIWEEMKAKSFLNYNVDLKKQEEHIEEFKALSLKEQKGHLCEILDKNQLYVNLSSIDDKDFACTKEEKQVTKDFYQMG